MRTKASVGDCVSNETEDPQISARFARHLLRKNAAAGEVLRLIRDGAKVNSDLEMGLSKPKPIAPPIVLHIRPLSWVAMRGNVRAAKVLLDEHAQVNAQDEKGNTALHFATSWGNASIVNLLLDSGADPKLKNLKGTSALNLLRFDSHNRKTIYWMYKHKKVS